MCVLGGRGSLHAIGYSSWWHGSVIVDHSGNAWSCILFGKVVNVFLFIFFVVY